MKFLAQVNVVKADCNKNSSGSGMTRFRYESATCKLRLAGSILGVSLSTRLSATRLDVDTVPIRNRDLGCQTGVKVGRVKSRASQHVSIVQRLPKIEY